MAENNPDSFIHTNVRVFYKIAQEAYVAMSEDMKSRIRKNPENEHGTITTYDPNQMSFWPDPRKLYHCNLEGIR